MCVLVVVLEIVVHVHGGALVPRQLGGRPRRSTLDGTERAQATRTAHRQLVVIELGLLVDIALVLANQRRARGRIRLMPKERLTLRSHSCVRTSRRCLEARSAARERNEVVLLLGLEEVVRAACPQSLALGSCSHNVQLTRNASSLLIVVVVIVAIDRSACARAMIVVAVVVLVHRSDDHHRVGRVVLACASLQRR